MFSSTEIQITDVVHCLRNQFVFVMRFFIRVQLLASCLPCFCGSQFTLSGLMLQQHSGCLHKNSRLRWIKGGVFNNIHRRSLCYIQRKLCNKRIPVVYDFAAVSYQHREITAQTINDLGCILQRDLIIHGSLPALKHGFVLHQQKVRVWLVGKRK